MMSYFMCLLQFVSLKPLQSLSLPLVLVHLWMKQYHVLLLKGKGWEWGPVYRDYLGMFTDERASFSEVEVWDIPALNLSLIDKEYDGYVLTGSTDDAHSSEEYVLNLIEHIQALIARKARLVGICYGHQLLCRAMGGKTGPSCLGWGMGPRTTILDEDASKFMSHCLIAYNRWKFPDYDPSNCPDALLSGGNKQINIFYSHQDQVLEPPACGSLKCFGRNEHCHYAGFFSDDLNIFTLQGHPEFGTDLMLSIIKLLGQNGSLQKIGYNDTINGIVENIKLTYKPDIGIYSSSLDSFIIGKCIIAVLLAP